MECFLHGVLIWLVEIFTNQCFHVGLHMNDLYLTVERRLSHFKWFNWCVRFDSSAFKRNTSWLMADNIENGIGKQNSNSSQRVRSLQANISLRKVSMFSHPRANWSLSPCLLTSLGEGNWKLFLPRAIIQRHSLQIFKK